MSQDFRFLIVDGIIALVLLISILSGRSQGIVRKLSGLVAAVGALVCGSIAKKTFYLTVSERWLRTPVSNTLEHARAAIGAEDKLSGLIDVLDSSKLPDFLKTGVLDKVTERLSTAISTAISEASVLIADRLSQILLFIVGAFVGYLVVKLLFNALLQPLIDKIGILKATNQLLGALAGALSGIVIVGVVLLLVYTLVPSLSAENGLLSSELVEKSYLTKLYFHALPKLFS